MKKIIIGILIFSCILFQNVNAFEVTFKNGRTLEIPEANIKEISIEEKKLEETSRTEDGKYIFYIDNVRESEEWKKEFAKQKGEKTFFYLKRYFKKDGKIYQYEDGNKEDENFNIALYLAAKESRFLKKGEVIGILNSINNIVGIPYLKHSFFHENTLYFVNDEKYIKEIGTLKEIRKKARNLKYYTDDLHEININEVDLELIDLFELRDYNIYIHKKSTLTDIFIFKSKKDGKFYTSKKNKEYFEIIQKTDSLCKENGNNDVEESFGRFINCVFLKLDSLEY